MIIDKFYLGVYFISNLFAFDKNALYTGNYENHVRLLNHFCNNNILISCDMSSTRFIFVQRFNFYS